MGFQQGGDAPGREVVFPPTFEELRAGRGDRIRGAHATTHGALCFFFSATRAFLSAFSLARVVEQMLVPLVTI